MQYFCKCMFAIPLSLFSSRRSRMRNLNSGYEIDQTAFTDWICFLTSNVVDKISLDP